MRSTRSIVVAVAALGALALAACGSDSNSSSTTAASGTAASTATTAAAGGSATTAASGGSATTAAAGAAVTGSLDAADQTGDGSQVTVKSVSINGAAGFIAIHQDDNGAPGAVVGHIAIPEGNSSDVVVKLDSKVATGKFWPMLHLDAGTIGTYEFPGADGPVKDANGVVMKQITLTVS